MHYIGLDVHKQSIVYCIKKADGTRVDRGTLEATRPVLERWAAALPKPWQAAMEATPFSGWIHDTLAPYADDLAVAHPADLEAITKSKKKSDGIDADKITDLLRVDLLERVWMPPREWRELRRLLRYRNRLIEQAVWHKNRIATALQELGEPYVKSKLHTKSYFYPYLDELGAGAEDALLLCASRERLEESERMARLIEKKLLGHPLLEQRVALLQTIPGVGVMTALTWAVEIGELCRFRTLDQIVSYCGLCAAERVGGQGQARAAVEAAQPAFAAGADRGGEVGAALQRGVGGVVRQGVCARPSQPGDGGGGAGAGGAAAGGGSPRHAVREALRSLWDDSVPPGLAWAGTARRPRREAGDATVTVSRPAGSWCGP